MKFKSALVILLLLNVAVLAWQWDAFAHWGFGPNLHREPERMQQQIRPEALTFEAVPAGAAASAAAADAVHPDASAALASASDAASAPAVSPVLAPAASAASLVPETAKVPAR